MSIPAFIICIQKLSFNGQGIVSIKAAIKAPTIASQHPFSIVNWFDDKKTINPIIKQAQKQATVPSKDLPAYILCLP